MLPAHLSSTDTTWTAVNPTICAQLMINVSIIATTLPFLHRVLAGLHTGILDTTLLTDHLDLSTPGPSCISDPLHIVIEPCVNATGQSRANSEKNRSGFCVASLFPRPRLTADIRNAAVHEPRELARNQPEEHPETGSTENLTRNEQEIIAQTRILQTLEIKVESMSRSLST